jgi:hypothetical protein
LLSEQGAVPIDQLARFLNRDRHRTMGLVEEFQRQNYARCESVLAGDADWVWLSKAGNRYSRTGLRCFEPRLGALPQIRALNELRLRARAEYPEAAWVSKRGLVREFGQYALIPDASLELNGNRQAILVRFHNRHFGDLEGRIESLRTSFASITVYCANPTVRERMLALGEPEPSLVIKDLPAGA